MDEVRVTVLLLHTIVKLITHNGSFVSKELPIMQGYLRTKGFVKDLGLMVIQVDVNY